MDSDSCTREQSKETDNQEKSDGPKQKGISWNGKSDGRNVFPTTRIRRAFSKHNEADKLILDYGFYFLLPVSTVIYSVFFILS